MWTKNIKKKILKNFSLKPISEIDIANTVHYFNNVYATTTITVFIIFKEITYKMKKKPLCNTR